MDCRLIHCEQGTDQWDALRRGRVTASRIGDIMAKPGSKRHEGYKRELTLELLGHTDAEDSPEWFRHGREQEPRALAYYEWKYGEKLDHDVFLIHKDYDWLSCSPDGLGVMNGIYGGGMELKCRNLYKNYSAAIKRAKKFADTDRLKCIEPGYRWQVQTSMWLTGWDHWWYVNYYEVKNQHGHPTGEKKIGRCPIPRDQSLIDEIEEAAVLFYADCLERAQLS
jgi:hypothetical protein